MPRVADDPLGKPVNARRAYAEENLLQFAYTYFSHLMPCEYGAWHKEFLYPEIEQALCPLGRLVGQCPRGHGKSLVGTTFTAIYAACKRLKRHIILIASSREDEGKNRLNELIHELETNVLLKNDYGREIMPHMDRGVSGGVKTTAWRDEMIVLGNGCQIQAIGFRGKIRGKKNVVTFDRPDMAILDDPENDEDVRSPDAREKAMDWVTGSLIPALDDNTGSIIWLGTYLHFDSALWNLVNKGKGTFRTFDVKMVEPFTPEGEILWPQRWTWEKIQQRFTEMTIAGKAEIFFREYLGTPLDKSKQVFPPENWRYYPVENLRCEKGRWYLIEGDKRWVMHTRISVDPAISEGAQADYTGVIVSGQLEDGRILLLEILQLKQAISVTTHRIRQLASTYKPLKTVVEANLFQAMYSQKLFEFGLNVQEIRHSTRKEDRIASMAGNVETGRVLLPTIGGKTTSDAQALIDQAAMWPKSPKDDLLDALCMNLESTLEMRGHHGLVLLKGSRQTPALTRSFSVSRDPKRDNPRPKIG